LSRGEGIIGSPIVHFELQGPDRDGTAKFYCQIFGWHTESMPGEEPYVMVDTHAGRGINGGFGRTHAGQPSNVAVYAGVPDVKAALKKAESLGAKTVVPFTEIPNIVTFALFADPQGAVVGLVQTPENQQDQSAGRPSGGDNAAVDYFEILSGDPKKAWDFYAKLFDWKVSDTNTEGFVYGMVDTGAEVSGGIGASQDGKPRVNVYAAVGDLKKYLAKAESLGGKTIVPPMKVGENTEMAHFADPQGTWLGIYVRT